MTDPVKIEIVGPVMTNSENPWRTQGDYLQDQKRQLHLYYFQAATLLLAVAGLVASAWFQYQASQQPPQKVEVQCIASPPAGESAQGGNTDSPQQTTKNPSKPQQQQVKYQGTTMNLSKRLGRHDYMVSLNDQRI